LVSLVPVVLASPQIAAGFARNPKRAFEQFDDMYAEDWEEPDASPDP
jgi:hypothetical protein